ncbi:nuclear transport factor 2 family protein [Rhodococcus sp. 06-418-5]|uniref:nuclear transport factor 2 family protein n=1 Tax=Rhodococcus sp. 06-418-5 TaxID=2022507 RepID=UPI00117A5B7F|nr:nuclear transport factor 2 family protein [Rhodococcus sp. 06-418-5]
MAATVEQASYVFREWHKRIGDRDAPALSELYAAGAVLESPLVPVLFDLRSGIVEGRIALDSFLQETTRRRSDENESPSPDRVGIYTFDGHRLVWEHPRQTANGDKLDLVEIVELDGPLISRHRIYWDWHGIGRIDPAERPRATRRKRIGQS